MSTEYVIWDLDNCIADDRPRIPLINWSLPGEQRWDAYHDACGADSVGNLPLVNLWHGNGTERAPLRVPVFFTARPERVRRQTAAWIESNFAWMLPLSPTPARPYRFRLFMRDAGDARSSVEIKRDMLARLRSEDPRGVVVHAYDDVPAIVEMYRACGFNAECLRIHDVETHKPPHTASRAIGATCDADITALEGLRPSKERDWAALRAETPRRVTADSVLGEMAALFRERNGAYKDNYKMVAPIMRTLFPDGVPPGLVLDDRWHLFELAVVKLTRFAISGLNHSDSARDAAVYLAMIDAINKERQ